VALAQQGDEREPHLVMLADDDALDVGDDLLARFLDPCTVNLPGGIPLPSPFWAAIGVGR
jgi:hypothetical protein